MSTVVSFNGSNYTIPAVGEKLWGNNVSNFLIAVGQSALSKAGGSFTLTADANFGSSFGIVVKYIKSSSSNIAQSGVVRFTNNEGIGWRNAANNADKLLKLNASDRLELDGVNIPTISSTDTLTNKTIVAGNNTITTASTGNLAATELNAALAELQSDIDARATSSALTSHTGASTGVHGVTGSVVGTSDAQVITNKDIDGGTASNTRRITVPKDSTSNLTALTRKQGTLLYDTSLLKLLVDNGTTLDAVGSGSGGGGVTLISNPSDAGNWSETGTVFATPVTTTTSGDLPLSGATSSAIKFVATGNGAEASHYNSYSVTTSAAMNGKLQVSFFFRPGTGFAANEWTVSVYQGSTRQTLSTDSSGVSYIPNTTNQYVTSFDAVASTAYTLRFARVSGSGSATLNVCNLFLGYPSVAQTAPVGNVSLTTSVIGAGNSSAYTNTTVTNCVGQQVGSWLLVTGKLTFTGLPATGTGALVIRLSGSGLTIDSTKSQNWSGSGVFYDASAGGAIYNLSPVPYMTSTNIDIQFVVSGDTASTTSVIPGSAPVAFANGDLLTFDVRIPIAEWAGSVNTAPVPAEEFASGAITSDANTTTTVYGPAGSRTPTASLTANRYAEITWLYPRQQDDEFLLEVDTDGNGAWLPHDANSFGSLGYVAQNTTAYGMYLTHVSASVSRVYFAVYAYPNGATYGSAGAPWSGSATMRYRVRKTKKAALPFANAGTDGSSGLYKAGQAPGIATTSSAFSSAGYIGEVKFIHRTSSGSMPTTGQWGDATDGTRSSITLTPGIWKIDLNWVYSPGGGTITIGNEMDAGFSTTSGNSATGLTSGINRAFWVYQTATSGYSQYWSGYLSSVVRCDGTNIYFPDGSSMTGTTLYWKLYHQTTGSVPVYQGAFYATRIA